MEMLLYLNFCAHPYIGNLQHLRKITNFKESVATHVYETHVFKWWREHKVQNTL
jgi:hypothetical protein